MMISSYNLDHGESLQLLYFTEVQNITEIVEKLTQFSHPYVNCTIINSKLILHPFQILVAANKAVVSKSTNTMITKRLSTELLFNLSISDNITESLHKFGYESDTNELLLAHFGNDAQQLESIVTDVQGNIQPICETSGRNCLDLIREIYGISKEQESYSSLLNLIVTKIACKSL